MHELASQLRSYIDETFLFGVDTDYGDHDSFLENGIIDSTGVLELIAYVEETFGFKVQDEDLVPENLDSVSGLVQFIAARQSQEVATP